MRPKLPLRARPRVMNEMTVSSGMSMRMSRCSIARPLKTADIPRMNRMLKMFEPTTLPRLTSALPDSDAPTLTAISGALVPKATTVRPMTIGAMPSRVAIDDAPRTSHSAPSTRRTSPPSRNRIVEALI
jgi:hypothetical protein